MSKLFKSLNPLYVAGALVAGAALAAPGNVLLGQDEEEECRIECETCTINLKEGTAECSNCTIKGCKLM